MNFLAHLYLAEPTAASRIGNILPDVVRGRRDAAWPADIARGVRTHRRVDAFTDTHPVFFRTRARFSERFGRFSGILVDMAYDHVLATRWDRHHATPLPAFAAEVYAQLSGAQNLMPEPMRPIVAMLAEQDWLCAYGTEAGLRLTLRRMSRRFTERFGREVVLDPAVDLLASQRGAVVADFEEFFPQLVRHVREATGAEPRVAAADRLW